MAEKSRSLHQGFWAVRISRRGGKLEGKEEPGDPSYPELVEEPGEPERGGGRGTMIF
jgi:hypothetical protein